MKKYEYKYLNYFEQKITLKLSEEEIFNELGREGWELIQISMMNGVAIFKREIEIE